MKPPRASTPSPVRRVRPSAQGPAQRRATARLWRTAALCGWVSMVGCAAGSSSGGEGASSGSGNDGTGNAAAGTSTATGGDGTAGSGASAGAGTTSGTGATGSGAGGSGDGGAAAPIVPTCQLGCTSVAQCNLGSLPYDSDNYTCSDDACHYEGCNSDTECQSLGAYVCRDVGLGMATCVLACVSAVQCATASAPYDADNYSCPDGYCVYEGCNSDTECSVLGNYVCRDPGGGTPVCVPACSEPSHCNLGSPPYDADNYDCIDGWCHYTGCNSDSECQYLGAYVCRP